VSNASFGQEILMTTWVVAKLAEHEKQAISAALDRAGREAEFFDTTTEARLRLESDRPFGLLVAADLDGVGALVSWIRGEGRLFSLPVIGIAATPTDSAFREAHAMGVDDVIVRGDEGAVTRRLANLGGLDLDHRVPVTQGRALIVQPEEMHRRVLGRILRQAGFDPVFAEGGEDIAAAGQESIRIAVVSEQVQSGVVDEAIAQLRSADGAEDMPVVMIGQATNDLLTRAKEIGKSAVIEPSAPADNLLFVANELLRSDLTNLRASHRILYGAICAFRAAGELHPIYGLTYNLSREGLFVRTLDPPSSGSTVWLEMRPMGTPAAVHLRAEVTWCRGLHSPGGATPPGFGMKLLPQACPPGDLAEYHDAYEELRKTRNLFTDRTAG